MKISAVGNGSWDVPDVEDLVLGVNGTVANLTDFSFNMTTSPVIIACPTTDPEHLRQLKIITLSVVGFVGFLIVACLFGCMFYKNDRLLEQLPWRKRDESEEHPYIYKMTVDSLNAFSAVGMGVMEQANIDQPKSEGPELEQSEEVKLDNIPEEVQEEEDQEKEATKDVKPEKEDPIPAIIDYNPFLDHYNPVQIPAVKEPEKKGLPENDKGYYDPESVKAVQEWLANTPSEQPLISVTEPPVPSVPSTQQKDPNLLAVPSKRLSTRRQSNKLPQKEQESHVSFADSPTQNSIATAAPLVAAGQGLIAGPTPAGLDLLSPIDDTGGMGLASASPALAPHPFFPKDLESEVSSVTTDIEPVTSDLDPEDNYTSSFHAPRGQKRGKK